MALLIAFPLLFFVSIIVKPHFDISYWVQSTRLRVYSSIVLGWFSVWVYFSSGELASLARWNKRSDSKPPIFQLETIFF